MLRYINPSKFTYALRLPRRELHTLVGLLTGHADLNRHLTMINVKSEALCPLLWCTVVQTTLTHSVTFNNASD